nr:hypothetical protein [Tanacetum cinerariifolium]
MLVVPAARDGADAVAAGAAAAYDVTPMREPTPVRDPIPVRDPTPVRVPTPSLVREPTLDSPRPPSPPPRIEEVGPTTSTRPPSPTRHTSVHEDISEGGGDFVSSPQSHEALQTSAAMAAGGAEDSAALIALSFKLYRCLNRVTTLENKLGITKKVLGGAVLKLVTRVKRLEGLLQQQKRRLLLSDSEGEDTTPTEQDINLEALHTLARTSLGGDSSDTPVGHDAVEVPADTSMPSRNPSTTRRRLRKSFSSSASAYVSKNIPAGVSLPATATTIPAGRKAPMVDDSLPIDLLSEQERVLNNLYDSQLREELAKKIHNEQEAEFARQQEELAQKAHAERVASPTDLGPGMSDQRHKELDAAQLIYTKADWLELLAKIATNSSLSKELLGDDVTEENMNERLVHAATSSAPADILVPAISSAHVAASVPAKTVVHTAASHVDDPFTASEHVSTKPTVAAPTPSSLRTRRKHIAKKRVIPIVDMADAAMIKFDSDSNSEDDPLPYAPYAGWEMVPSPLGSVHAYHDMTGHTKHFTTLRELLYMVEKTDLQKLMGAVDELYQQEDPDTFALLFEATLERMLKHGLEVPKLLVGGDLTMAEQLVGFIKAALLNAKSAV